MIGAVIILRCCCSPSGEIVMTYVVRKGYVDSPDGFPQFGVEAVVSRDHGQTWDLDHRYILHHWIGHIEGATGLDAKQSGNLHGPVAGWLDSHRLRDRLSL